LPPNGPASPWIDNLSLDRRTQGSRTFIIEIDDRVNRHQTDRAVTRCPCKTHQLERRANAQSGYGVLPIGDDWTRKATDLALANVELGSPFT